MSAPRRRIITAALFASALCAAASAAALVSASGSASSPRIVGGQPAPSGAYPWMTALVQAGEDARPGQICGATAISPTRLLTAAHCLAQEKPKRIDAVVGAERLSADDGERIGVTRHSIDPGAADLALLRLARPSPGPPVTLAGPGDEPLFAPGQTARALGWGLTSQDGRRGSDELRQVDVPIVSDADCATAYRTSEPPFRPAKEICAGARGLDACGGDSGGPLLVDDGGGTLKQVGVVSFGRGCGRARFPGVYSEVPASLDFVASQRPIWAPEPGRRVRISGRPRVGRRLRCSDGRWLGRQIEFHFSWFGTRAPRRLDRGPTFRPGGSVAGQRIFCVVVAENPGGVAFQQSKSARIERSGQ